MKIAFFKAECSKCGTLFDTPLLSDFSYGEFIARSEDGTAVAYLNALEEPAVEAINIIFSNILKKYGTDLDEKFCFHYVLGKCSDRIEGQEMKLGIGPICPACKSSSCNYDNLKKADKREVQKLSFTSFTALSGEEKSSLIKEHINHLKIYKMGKKEF